MTVKASMAVVYTEDFEREDCHFRKWQERQKGIAEENRDAEEKIIKRRRKRRRRRERENKYI